MAKKIFEEVNLSDQYKLKKFFYALRASVACKWILEKEEMPPIEFSKMVNGLDLPNHLTSRIKELIALKATIGEAYLHSGEQELLAFMKDCMDRADNESKNLPSSTAQMAAFNDFFRKTLD